MTLDTPKKTIGIDARFVGPQGTGLGKYTEKLITNLCKIDSKNNYKIFLRKDNWDYLDLPKNFGKVLADVKWYSLSEQIKLPSIFSSANLDILHVPHFNVPIFYRGKFLVTIHDLIHHQFSETSATTRNPIIFKGKRLAYKTIIGNAIKNSQKIITPSSYVKSQILKHYAIPSAKIIVTYESAEEEYLNAKENPQVLKKYKLEKPFIVYVGNAYPHKNLDNLLEAFKILFMNDELKTMNLVIVCSRDVFAARLSQKVKNLGIEKKVILPGYISAKELPSIFASAGAYIFPTLSEGFGIPGLNAMAANLPVACSDIEVLREVYKDTALYFDPKDPQDIADKITKIVNNPRLQAQLKSAGQKLASSYSWSRMAEQTLKIYESVS